MKGTRYLLGKRYLVPLLILAAAGCSKAPEVSYEPPAESAPAQTAASVDPATAGRVSGEVVFEGAPPAATPIEMKGNPECSLLHAVEVPGEDVLVSGGKLQNVFIYVKQGLEAYVFPASSEPVVIDQKGCLYLPHVSGALVNQPITLLNSDPTLHNIHAYSEASGGWNVGLPFQGMKIERKFSAPEIMVKLKCDVHPWMSAYMGIVAHPYFAVTGLEGMFSLKGLPPGSYVIEAWHERFGTRSQSVELAAQEDKQISFSFSP